MKKLRLLTLGMLMATAMSVTAGEKLSLRAITKGEFRSQTISEVQPMADGESYAQMSDNGKQILTYAFRTGKQTGVLFDATTARGASIGRIDGYIISPDGSRLLIQTNTKSIYRRSNTATYYI